MLNQTWKNSHCESVPSASDPIPYSLSGPDQCRRRAPEEPPSIGQINRPSRTARGSNWAMAPARVEIVNWFLSVNAELRGRGPSAVGVK